MEAKKRSKAKIAEKRRNTTMTFRTQKMVESLTEIAARSQGISVSEYLERSTKVSFDHVMVDKKELNEPNKVDLDGNLVVNRMDSGRPLSELASELYDDDDVKCLLKRVFHHPWSLNEGQRRVLKLIQISPVLYPKVHSYNEEAIREHWSLLSAVANRNASIDTLPSGLFGTADIAFALMSEAEQVAVYKVSREEFLRRSRTHLPEGRR